MYTKELIDRIGYFQDVEIDSLLDSLTGVLRRGYILDLAKKLIEDKKPFTMAMLDIDNFKFVNDNYGHIVGDECLQALCKQLVSFIGDKGVVGRYGGDEFIIIYFGEHDYQEAHAFAFSLYGPTKVVRRSYHLSTVQLFVTATVGNASFPKDADNYEELLSMVDKTLYRGKTKGRNCYITYVKEKHEHIDVHKKEDNSSRVLFRTMNDIVRLNENRDVLIKYLLDSLTSLLGVTQSLFVKEDGYTISSAYAKEVKTSDIHQSLIDNSVIDDEIYIPSSIDKFTKRVNEELRWWINQEKIQTFLITEVRNLNEKYGNVILLEKNVQRIWQDRDIALMMYVDKLIEILFLK